MTSASLQYCARCGRAFRLGQTRYLVSIAVVADFDGTIDPAPGPGTLARMWREIEEKTEEELANEVAQRLSFVLCKPCRDAWVSAPLGEEIRDETTTGHVH